MESLLRGKIRGYVDQRVAHEKVPWQQTSRILERNPSSQFRAAVCYGDVAQAVGVHDRPRQTRIPAQRKVETCTEVGGCIRIEIANGASQCWFSQVEAYLGASSRACRLRGRGWTEGSCCGGPETAKSLTHDAHLSTPGTLPAPGCRAPRR
eukprot:916839-Rhodomonas_salina.1